ncbi:KilA-N domain-containing protein [Nostoc sp.]|uniref:KilA-N domain-containing protein n=1 Tax=Nostoc sp. TaxID=1180 RepID=UPI002FFB632F
MSQIEYFDKLVQNAHRDDDYINATKLCKHFGYRLDNWKQLPGTKARLTELSERLKIEQSSLKPWIVERVGNTWATWVHPIMAVHLASYLDPGFANYIAKILIKYVTADPTLAADIASRQETTEGRDIIKKAVQERYEFLKCELASNYYIIKDAWGDKLYYNTRTGRIQLDGSPLSLQSLKTTLRRELNVEVNCQDAEQIVKILAIINTYPLMDAADQQIFKEKYSFDLRTRNFVPTPECPTPPKLI